MLYPPVIVGRGARRIGQIVPSMTNVDALFLAWCGSSVLVGVSVPARWLLVGATGRSAPLFVAIRSRSLMRTLPGGLTLRPRLVDWRLWPEHTLGDPTLATRTKLGFTSARLGHNLQSLGQI